MQSRGIPLARLPRLLTSKGTNPLAARAAHPSMATRRSAAPAARAAGDLGYETPNPYQYLYQGASAVPYFSADGETYPTRLRSRIATCWA